MFVLYILNKHVSTFLYSLSFMFMFGCSMEVILDELRKNNVVIDMRTLSYYMNYLLDKHESMCQSMVVCSLDFAIIFYEINVVNFGRAIAYLTLVYLMKLPEDEIRSAVQLVVTPLRSFDLTEFKIKESFFDKMMSVVKNLFSS